jgi:hypothetical protein
MGMGALEYGIETGEGGGQGVLVFAILFCAAWFIAACKCSDMSLKRACVRIKHFIKDTLNKV